jgi:hypothetical protein
MLEPMDKICERGGNVSYEERDGDRHVFIHKASDASPGVVVQNCMCALSHCSLNVYGNSVEILVT